MYPTSPNRHQFVLFGCSCSSHSFLRLQAQTPAENFSHRNILKAYRGMWGRAGWSAACRNIGKARETWKHALQSKSFASPQEPPAITNPRPLGMLLTFRLVHKSMGFRSEKNRSKFQHHEQVICTKKIPVYTRVTLPPCKPSMQLPYWL